MSRADVENGAKAALEAAAEIAETQKCWVAVGRIRNLDPATIAAGVPLEDQWAEIKHLNAKVKELEEWKREALIVIELWESVWEAVGKPGKLGENKSLSTAEEIKRLRARIDYLEEFR